MAKQLRLPGTTRTNLLQFKAVELAREGAARYAEEQGMSWSSRGLDQQEVDPHRGHAQMLAYSQAQKAPEASNARGSYEAMREHVNRQYEFMTRPEEHGGMGLRVETTKEDPYPSPGHMAEDIVANKRIKVFSTASTGGHEFFTNEENDRFRAVHDVFGHAAIGRGFSRHGEEAAFRSHRQMFPSEALPALTSETRGQNSYLNYSPQGGFPDQGPGSDLVIMPKWAESNRALPTPRRPIFKKQGTQLQFPGMG